MGPKEQSQIKLSLIMECLLSCAFSKDEDVWLFASGAATSPDPVWTDYIYWSDRYGLDGAVAAAVAKAFAYQPVIPTHHG
jgi:hypothetical protein